MKTNNKNKIFLVLALICLTSPIRGLIKCKSKPVNWAKNPLAGNHCYYMKPSKVNKHKAREYCTETLGGKILDPSLLESGPLGIREAFTAKAVWAPFTRDGDYYLNTQGDKVMNANGEYLRPKPRVCIVSQNGVYAERRCLRRAKVICVDEVGVGCSICRWSERYGFVELIKGKCYTIDSSKRNFVRAERHCVSLSWGIN